MVAVKIYELMPREWVPYALVELEGSPFAHTFIAVNREYERPGAPRDWDLHYNNAIVFTHDPRGLDCWAEVIGPKALPSRDRARRGGGLLRALQLPGCGLDPARRRRLV